MRTKRVDFNKWNDRRFRSLSLEAKVLYCYMWDQADLAGFYTLKDIDLTCFTTGLTDDQLSSAWKELTAVRESPNGRNHRGFVQPGRKRTIWISHYIDHTQDSFGKVQNYAFKPIFKRLIEMWPMFYNEQEYIEFISSIQQWMGFISPLFGEEPQQQNKAPESDPNIENEVIDAFNSIIAPTPPIVGSQRRYRTARELSKEGFTIEDIKKVLAYKKKEWGQDPKFKKNLQFEILLKLDKFQMYLDQANQDTTTNSNTAAYDFDDNLGIEIQEEYEPDEN